MIESLAKIIFPKDATIPKLEEQLGVIGGTATFLAILAAYEVANPSQVLRAFGVALCSVLVLTVLVAVSVLYTKHRERDWRERENKANAVAQEIFNALIGDLSKSRAHLLHVTKERLIGRGFNEDDQHIARIVDLVHSSGLTPERLGRL